MSFMSASSQVLFVGNKYDRNEEVTFIDIVNTIADIHDGAGGRRYKMVSESSRSVDLRESSDKGNRNAADEIGFYRLE